MKESVCSRNVVKLIRNKTDGRIYACGYIDWDRENHLASMLVQEVKPTEPKFYQNLYEIDKEWEVL